MHFSNILHFFSPAAGKIEMTLCPLLVGVNRKQALSIYVFLGEVMFVDDDER